jgi:2-isopropylmalate synthase
VQSEEAQTVLDEIKQLENKGFVFEGAEASVAIMLHRAKPGYKPPFRLVDFTVLVRNGGDDTSAEATIKLEVEGEIIHTAAMGNGPVNALDQALRKALVPVYPYLADFQLADYKVRILDGENGTAATTRVMIETRNKHARWSTVGASANIIEASWLALVDSVEYGLTLAPHSDA